MMNETKTSLDELIADFIIFKRSIGYAYQTEAYYLNNFKEQCYKMGCVDVPGKNEFREWMKKRAKEQPQTQHARMSPIREFHKYLYNIGIDTGCILPKGIKGSNVRHVPHFFNDNEISLFFERCDSLPRRKENPGREIILPVALRLLYCCGLRPIEVITLKTENVNLKIGFIDILHSKKHKDRRLYLSDELTLYLAEYKRKINVIYTKHEYFFPKDSKKHYNNNYLRNNFRKIWSEICNDNRENVRLYDMRHHFAFANLNRWVEEGSDVNSKIAYLMKYMGHSSIESTYYYLHLVPEFFSTYVELTRSLSFIIPEVEDED